MLPAGCCGGESLSAMETVAAAGLPSVAPPVGAESVTVKVSVPSTRVSSASAMEIVRADASPSAQARVPLAGVKSAPEAAVPGAEA